MEVGDISVGTSVRLLPSLDSLYPYFLDSKSGTKEDIRGITSDLFQQKHHMFFVRPSLHPPTTLAEVRISPFAIIPERKIGGCGTVQS